MKKYKFWNDPGHGWLEVTRKELEELNIANKISSYSYLSKDGKIVYLEEDCDAGVFIKAAKITKDDIIYKYQENIFVRRLSNYKI